VKKDRSFCATGRGSGDRGPEKYGAEIRLQALFRDRFVGVLAKTHPLAQGGKITRERYAACEHVIVSRHGMVRGPVDDALAEFGLSRKIAAVVPGFTAALAVARGSQLMALVPASCLRHGMNDGIVMFELPVSTPEITVSQMWHPRQELDPGHYWLRQQGVERLSAGDMMAKKPAQVRAKNTGSNVSNVVPNT
jgi:DNA-binding transcriptional LysR family regulator